jgi:hypothetical protein
MLRWVVCCSPGDLTPPASPLLLYHILSLLFPLIPLCNWLEGWVSLVSGSISVVEVEEDAK